MKNCETLFTHAWEAWGGWDDAREWTYVRCAVCLTCAKLSRAQVARYRALMGTTAWARYVREHRM